MHEPTANLLTCVNRILCYVVRTVKRILRYDLLFMRNATMHVATFVDANFVGDSDYNSANMSLPC